MADTSYIKKEVEPWVRNWLTRQFPEHRFDRRHLVLTCITQEKPGSHEFDAVSEDGTVVAAIKGHSWKTSGGNLPAAKYASMYQELYFLTLVKADRRFLILTNEEMYSDFQNRSKGKIADGIELMFCQLTDESMRRRMQSIGDEASREMTR